MSSTDAAAPGDWPRAAADGSSQQQPQQPQPQQQQGQSPASPPKSLAATLPPPPSPLDHSYLIMDNCAVKAAFAGVGGCALGAVFGGFLSATSSLPDELAEAGWRKQMAEQFRAMGRQAWSFGKNFGLVGLMFAGSECLIEQTRGKSDALNGISAGCLTGGALSYRAGPQAMVFGCVTFAAFSAAIDYFTGRHDGGIQHDDVGFSHGTSPLSTRRTPTLLEQVAAQYKQPIFRREYEADDS